MKARPRIGTKRREAHSRMETAKRGAQEVLDMLRQLKERIGEPPALIDGNGTRPRRATHPLGV